MGDLRTQTIVFTDVVGSTAQRVALGDDAADALMRRHDATVREVTEASGGRVVKALGDGALACFGSTADAVTAAVRLQQAMHRQAAAAAPAERLTIRIGIATGDVREADGDVLGTAVVEASRLCAAAAGGEILVAELVRMLSRSRSEETFEPLGDIELRGLPEPVPACRVLWAPAAPPATVLPLPPALAAAPASSYVGRGHLLEELRLAWKLVDGGGRCTVLLAGEPGIGKTRTAAELARSVHDEGALVLLGRCDEGLAAPYQPFVEALAGYVDALRADAELGRLPGELQRLVPELADLVPGTGAPVRTDVRSEEYRLFESVTSWLISSSRRSGLLLVLDDLHWAPRPTLQMLLHVLRRLRDEPDARVLVLATYRDTDVDRAHPLTGALADLRRQPEVKRLSLVGLDETDVLQVVEEAAGHELDERERSLTTVLHAETEGNPFFVGEVLRHLVESGAVRRVDDRWVVPDVVDLDIPEGVRDVVGRRASRLSDSANRVLSVASVVGREASVDVLAAASGLDDAAVCDALDEGVRARLLHETAADHYRFTHALVRTTLYEELSATRRRRMHRQVADVLERLHPDDVAGLAHHLVQAGPQPDDGDKVLRYVLTAGEQALAARAPADAEGWFRQALELCHDTPASARSALAASISLGRAQYDQGDSRYRETLLDAAGRAVAQGEHDLLVVAVLANQRGWTSMMGRVDVERVALVERALEVVPARTPARARLLALLASEVVFGGDPSRSRRLAAEAVALIREVGDEATTAAVLVQASGPAYDPDDLRGWARLTQEAAQRAAALGDPALEALGSLFHAAALLALGDVAAARALTERMQSLGAACSPVLQWAMRAQLAKFVIAEQPPAIGAAENDATLALGEQAGDADRLNWWAATATCIHLIRHHRMTDLVELAEQYAQEFPATAAWRGTVALALADGGRLEEARLLLDQYGVTAERLRQEPFPSFGPNLLARIAFRCEDTDLAEQVQQVLEPHRDEWVHFYTGVIGPVVLPLGLCASVLGRHDEGVALLDASCAGVAEAGLASLLLIHEVDRIAVLVRSGRADHLRRVRELCPPLIARAASLDCPGTVAEAQALLARATA